MNEPWKRPAESLLEKESHKTPKMETEKMDHFLQTERHGITALNLSKVWDSIANQVNWYQVANDAEAQMASTYRKKFQEIMYAYFEKEIMEKDMMTTHFGETSQIAITNPENFSAGSRDEDRIQTRNGFSHGAKQCIVISDDENSGEEEDGEEESAYDSAYENESADDTDEEYVPLEIDGSDDEFNDWEVKGTRDEV